MSHTLRFRLVFVYNIAGTARSIANQSIELPLLRIALDSKVCFSSTLSTVERSVHGRPSSDDLRLSILPCMVAILGLKYSVPHLSLIMRPMMEQRAFVTVSRLDCRIVPCCLRWRTSWTVIDGLCVALKLKTTNPH